MLNAMDTSDLSLIAQTTYAELLDLCHLQAFDAAFAEVGTFSAKNVKGRRYWYFQPARRSAGTATISQRYVGPETDDLLQRIAQHRQVKREQNAQREMVRALVHSYGLPAPLPAVGQAVEGLARSGVFRLRAVMVGNVAYQTYAAVLGVRLRGALVQTADVDVSQFLSVSLAIQDKTETMKEILKAIDPTFREITALRRGATTQYMSSNQLRVDILVPNQNADSDEPLYLPALQTRAEPLRFLDFLIHEPVKAVLLHGSGIAVTVPAPERFAVHKLILSRRRKSTRAKSEIDLEQAAVLLQVLVQKRPEELKRVWEEALQRGPTWRELLLAGAGQLPTSVQDNLKASGVISGQPPSPAKRASGEDRIFVRPELLEGAKVRRWPSGK